MKVSIITPTLPSRSQLLERCRSIVSIQDYDNIEHIIVSGPGSIGAKLNFGIEQSTGDIIIRFDDDDLYADDYVSKSVKEIQDGASMTGVCKFYLYNPVNGGIWLYDYTGSLPYIAGSGSAFTRSEWERNRYPNSSRGEDGVFCMNIRGIVQAMDYPDGMVAILHGSNTESHNNLHTFEKMRDIKSKLIDQYYIGS